MVSSVKLSDAIKRKRDLQDAESDIDISSTDSEDESDKNEEEQEVVNIDFDFFNGNKNVDFHAFKNLLRQLLGPQESNKLQLSALADLVLDSPTTTIKTDGQESDPYCFLSFIDYRSHRDSEYARYLGTLDPRIGNFLKTIDNSNQTCALVLSERLINMPPEIIAPIYNITLEDASNSLGKGKHYDYYVMVSRKFEVNVEADDDDKPGQSRKRVKSSEIDYFHEEDRFLERNAKIHFDSESRKGLVSSYVIIEHASLVKSIQEVASEVATW
ncbi:LANO_0H22628g1_1 [Lachancea nothofagi CBS 11611]|uniref:Protein BCP1 n=1 Tax=Lachancea nothofagi CBS 11611 TaxID=1266666 RepID=A0A1G4KNI5_9SACH|nr:LANO_0H22628g1_1 [Lachancea nothofagi CBS 11611]